MPYLTLTEKSKATTKLWFMLVHLVLTNDFMIFTLNIMLLYK